MKARYTINNYMMGTRFRQTPYDKVISTKRIDKNHTEITYEFGSQREKEQVDYILYGQQAAHLQGRKGGEIIEG